MKPMQKKMSKLPWLIALCLAMSAQAQGLKLEYQRVENGALITGHGTAFGIDERHLMTAAHNILDEKGKARSEVFVGGDRVKVVKFDAALDLALLESSTNVRHEEFGMDAKAGDKIVLSGSKRGQPVTEHKGKVVTLNHEGSCQDLMQVDFDHGDSGAPVLCNGKVVGIAVAGIPKNEDMRHDVGKFIRTSIILDFLRDVKGVEFAK